MRSRYSRYFNVNIKIKSYTCNVAFLLCRRKTRNYLIVSQVQSNVKTLKRWNLQNSASHSNWNLHAKNSRIQALPAKFWTAERVLISESDWGLSVRCCDITRNWRIDVSNYSKNYVKSKLNMMDLNIRQVRCYVRLRLRHLVEIVSEHSSRLIFRYLWRWCARVESMFSRPRKISFSDSF